MSRVCSVCQHPDLRQINGLLIEGVSYRDVARQFGVSKDAVARHRADHLPEFLSRAKAAADVADADSLLDQLDQLQRRAGALLDRAEHDGDLRTALGGIRELRAGIALIAELRGEIDRRPTVTLVSSPEWLAVRTAILEALSRHPDARLAVVAALSRVDAGA